MMFIFFLLFNFGDRLLITLVPFGAKVLTSPGEETAEKVLG